MLQNPSDRNAEWYKHIRIETRKLMKGKNNEYKKEIIRGIEEN